MKALSQLGFIVGACFSIASLCSCGGSTSLSPVSDYAGHYQGTWSRPAADGLPAKNGTIDIMILSSGAITGSSTSNDYGTNGSLNNSPGIRSGGSVDILMLYSVNGTPFGDEFTGNLKKNSDGSLEGTLKENVGDFDIPATFSMMPV